jgi:hypothetical protein
VWLTGLGAAVAGPYLLFDGNLPSMLNQGRQQFLGQPQGTSEWLGGGVAPDPAQAGDPYNTPVMPITNVLRPDITPEWVVSQWPRVATVVGELEWAGMRVPLITGSQSTDLVGSLTYYFDNQQRLRRILLEGYTGDERPLVTFGMQYFGLLPEPSLHGGVYVSRWNREPLSALAVQYASVVNADSPQTRRRVMFEYNRPDPTFHMSAEMRALIG